MAHDADIPVIAYDRIIRDSDLDLYVSFDNVKVGELQARYLVDHLPAPGKGRIVRIYGAKTDNNATLFKQGQDNVLAPYIERGDIVVVHEDWAEDWKPENAKRIVNAAISAHGDALRRGARQQRRHRGRRHPGAAGRRPRRQETGHRPGCRARRLPAHRQRHAGHDDLQAAQDAGAQRRRSCGAHCAAQSRDRAADREQRDDRCAVGSLRRGHRHEGQHGATP